MTKAELDFAESLLLLRWILAARRSFAEPTDFNFVFTLVSSDLYANVCLVDKTNKPKLPSTLIQFMENYKIQNCTLFLTVQIIVY